MQNPVNFSDFEKAELLWEYVRTSNTAPTVNTVYKNWQLGAWFNKVKQSKGAKYKEILKCPDEYINIVIRKELG